jgi:protein-disulfide isomerase
MAPQSGHLALSAAIIIAGAMISGSIMWSSNEARQSVRMTAPVPQPLAESAAPVQPPVDVADVVTDGEPFVGSATAPVEMALWTDYQCPY